MMQAIPQTRKQRAKMYRKMKKRKLVEMLMDSQDAVKRLYGVPAKPEITGVTLNWRAPESNAFHYSVSARASASR